MEVSVKTISRSEISQDNLKSIMELIHDLDTRLDNVKKTSDVSDEIIIKVTQKSTDLKNILFSLKNNMEKFTTDNPKKSQP